MRSLRWIVLTGFALMSISCSEFLVFKGTTNSNNNNNNNNNNVPAAKAVQVWNCSTEEIRVFKAPVGTSNWSSDYTYYMGAPFGDCHQDPPNSPIYVDLGTGEYKVRLAHRQPNSNVPTPCNLDNPNASNHCDLEPIGTFQGDLTAAIIDRDFTY